MNATGARGADTPPDGIDLEKLAAEALRKNIEQAQRTAAAVDRAKADGRRFKSKKHKVGKPGGLAKPGASG